jgi:hypothetical protein
MTTQKFNRRFKLTYQINDEEALIVRSPLTIEFDIQRNTASSLNSAVIKIYNLSLKNRNLLFKSRTSLNDLTDRKYVILQAGYETALNKDSEMSVIFQGYILEADSYREGTNIITYISAQDGGIGVYNSTISKTFAGGLSLVNLFKQVASEIQDVTIGKVGNIEGNIKTSATLNGNAFYLLTNRYFSEKVFIDLGKINLMNLDEYIKTPFVPLITTKSGLLGTPRRQGNIVDISLMFEPRIQIQQLIEIKSSVNPIWDGQYKVIGLKHQGIISGAVGGDLITNLQLFIGDKLLKELKGI